MSREAPIPVAEGLAGKRPRTLLAGLLLLVGMFSFDNLAVTAIMPGVEKDLGGGELYGMVFSSFLLASLFSVVWAGEQTDRRGPFLPFAWGTGLFLAGNIGAAWAPNMAAFVGARCVQGLGGGMITAVVYATVNLAFDQSQRPRVLAFLSMMWAIPGLLAPGVAGFVADSWHWRYNFGGLAILIAGAGAVSWPGMRRLAKPSIEAGRRSTPGGSPAALGLAVSVGVGLHIAGGALGSHWEFVARISLLAAAVVAARISLNRIAPQCFDVADPVRGSVAIRFIIALAFYALDVFLPRLLVEEYQVSLLYSGVVLSVCAISWSGASYLQSSLSRWASSRSLVLAGAGLLVSGIAIVLAMLLLSGPAWWTFIGWSLAGMGMGFAFNTLLARSMQQTPSGSEGATGKLNGLCDSLSVALAAGMGAAVINWGSRTGAAGTESYVSVSIGALLLVLFAAVLCVRHIGRGEQLS